MSARDEAASFIASDPALAELATEVDSAVEDDPGHDLEHCLRVGGWALRCGPEEAPRELITAALLHDVVNLPKNAPNRASASVLSAEYAARRLPSLGFAPSAVSRICEAIEDHSYSRGAVPRSRLGDALQDADRLEALGALGLCRTLSTGAKMGARYFDARDPWAQDRPLDDRRFTVDHFFTKLLGLPETMRTRVGREEAHRRAAHLRSFLEQLASEIGHPLAVPL